MEIRGRHLHSAILTTLIGVLMVSCGQEPSPSPPEIVEATAMPTATATNGSGWELVWEDAFGGDRLDTDNWTAEIGAGGWGNNEWQFYTDRAENLRVQDGLLIIEAREKSYRGSDYTSARIKTQYLHSWTYGRVEARMKIPNGQGIWPAFWMLGSDFPTAGWPDCGEIDIMENIGEPRTVYGTVHGPGYSGGDSVGQAYSTSGEPFFEDFHTYAVEWSPSEISWFVDGDMYNTISATEVPGEWVFDHPFFILLNLAVGGNWPGYPDQSTEFPQQLLVDYVRVYRDTSLSAEELQGDVLQVTDITLGLEQLEDNWQAEAMVSVVDSKGDPVEGVEVTAGWLGVVTGGTSSAVTDANGDAGPFIARMTSFADEVTFCVTDLTKPLNDYDKAQNALTCATKAPPTSN